MAVTLKEIGRLAGVHPSTVARVLNKDPHQRVSDPVRQRILTVAAERGYQPNHLARSLRTKRSSVIGTLIPDITNPFFALLYRGIEDALAERDYSVILANTDDELVREERGIAMFQGRQVDGLILATARRRDPAIARLMQDHVPLVQVNRHTDPITPNAVVPADYDGAIAAVTHLIELGHRRIAHIAGSDEMSTGAARRRGYLDALARHGIGFDLNLLAPGSYREQGGYEAMHHLLASAEPPTAVFAVNDLAAAGALRALREAGLETPRDVSVVGFNDLATVVPTAPSLTTVHLPVHMMGMVAGERLLARILHGVTLEEPVILPVTLAIRESSGPAPRLRRLPRMVRTGNIAEPNG